MMIRHPCRSTVTLLQTVRVNQPMTTCNLRTALTVGLIIVGHLLTCLFTSAHMSLLGAHGVLICCLTSRVSPLGALLTGGTTCVCWGGGRLGTAFNNLPSANDCVGPWRATICRRPPPPQKTHHHPYVNLQSSVGGSLNVVVPEQVDSDNALHRPCCQPCPKGGFSSGDSRAEGLQTDTHKRAPGVKPGRCLNRTCEGPGMWIPLQCGCA
jgi:hypothetical protein